MTKLIIGCGYLGRRVAQRWQAAGHSVVVTTRSPDKARQFVNEGLQAVVADVTMPETLTALPQAETVLFSVGYDRRNSYSRWDVGVRGLGHVLSALAGAPERIILISSTGVYGETGSDWVDEETPCRPTREAGRVFLAAERLLADHSWGDRSIVLRMAGIYGPGRLPRMEDVRSGRTLFVRARTYVNLIHVDDAAAVVLHAEARACPPRTYVISDGHPVDRQAFYVHLAGLLAAPTPTFEEPGAEIIAQQRGGSSKRIRNSRMLDELRVLLSYPDYQQGLAAIVGDSV